MSIEVNSTVDSKARWVAELGKFKVDRSETENASLCKEGPVDWEIEQLS